MLSGFPMEHNYQGFAFIVHASSSLYLLPHVLLSFPLSSFGNFGISFSFSVGYHFFFIIPEVIFLTSLLYLWDLRDSIKSYIGREYS